MTTMKDFLDHTSIRAPLVQAVVRKVGGWGEFKEIAHDVARYGAGGGFSGFIYHTDTVAFAKRHRTYILQQAGWDAESLGVDTLRMIADFNVLKDLKLSPTDVAQAIYEGKGDDVYNVLNALAWYALEEVARAYDDYATS